MNEEKYPSSMRVREFYTVGKSDKELLAYDEYDSIGSGEYFTDDVLMCDRYTWSEAVKSSREHKLDIYYVSITKYKNYDIKISLFRKLGDYR